MKNFRRLAIVMALSTIIWTAVILLSDGIEEGRVFSYFIGASGCFSVVAIVAAAKRLRYKMAVINATASMCSKGIHEMETESLAVEIALHVVSIMISIMWLNHWFW